jgi:uncharacterized metal-binding protein YceD (DUF177 family)
MSSKSPDTAFSYPVKVGHVSANPVTVQLSADADERAALARLWGVESVESLEAEFQVSRWKRDGVRVKGDLHARLTQACVVTLEPVKAVIEAPVEALFVPEGSRLARGDADSSGEVVVDPEGPDMPETFSGDEIDLGAVASEFAALSIDPYPRAAGAAFSPDVEAGSGDEEGDSPFAALKGWQKKDG